MKLYSSYLSPFSGRARMAVYAKGLPVEISYPPQEGLNSPEYLAINPMGKMPCLLTRDGVGLPESEVILEYLEDKFPEPSLRPASPEDRARVRLIARIGELYVGAPGGALFGQFDPAKRDQAVVDATMTKLHQGLAWLDQHLSGGDYAVGDTLTTADCSLTPTLFFLTVYAKAFDRPDLIDDHPKVKRYIETVRANPAAAKVWDEMTAAAAHWQATGQFS
jgi:glutathione S-transferase